MRFTKMEGLGNDYVYVNGFEENVENPNELAIKVSDRHFGIGSDGLILVLPSTTADFKMRMFNADGSEGKMCGNGVRCVGKFVYDKGLTDKTTVTVETLGGIKVLDLTVENGQVTWATVDMGEPILKSKEVPVIAETEEFINQKFEVDGQVFNMTAVSMGNPHTVTYVDDVDNFPLEVVGPKVENHECFPERVNAEFVQVIDEETLKMRVWERGSAETLACGTGACAVLVASVLNGKSKRKATVQLKGGDLIIEWREEDNHIYMTGPAKTVFEGEYLEA